MSHGSILVVDDDRRIQRLISRVLEKRGDVVCGATEVREARDWLAVESFALVLLDVAMPGESGLVLLDELARRRPDVVVVMLTASDSPELAETAFELGAYGYMVKPFRPSELLIGVANALRRREAELANRAHRERLEELVVEQTASLEETLGRLRRSERDLRLSREETVRRLARAVEARDSETGRHVERASAVCELIALRLGLDAERCELIRVAMPLHDIGKIVIPDSLLRKPGALTEKERTVFERHARVGHEILAGSGSELLELAATMAVTHHERFDGSGYPMGLAGSSIPLEGRIAAVADVFDALVRDRPYRRALPLDQALAIMRAGRGTEFDPEVLDAFFDSLDEVLALGDFDGLATQGETAIEEVR